MKKQRRKFSSAFKAEVAIEAIKERMTLAEISRKYNVHANMISKWKNEFMGRSSEIFETQAPVENYQKEKDELYAKIGKLEMECDWLKKISKRAGL